MAQQKSTAASRNELATTVQNAILYAIADRVDAQIAKNETPSVEWERLQKKIETEDFPRAVAKVGEAVNFEHLCESVRNTVKGDFYIQAKTVEKVVKVIFAIAYRDHKYFDPYLMQVYKNAIENGGALSMQGAQASLSRAVAKTNNESIKSRGTASAGTSTAQASQCRMAAYALGLATCRKGAKADTMVFTPFAIKALQEIFA